MDRSDSRVENYHLAILMSLVSSIGWLGFLLLGPYTLYLSLTGATAGTVAWYALGSVAIGITFARLERYCEPPGFRR